MPRSRISSPRSSGRSASHPVERGLGARGRRPPRGTRAPVALAAPGTRSAGATLDRLGVGGGRAGLAGPVEQLRAQRKEGRALVLVRVLERQLGPLGAVAVGAHAGGPLGRPGEERDGLPRAAGAQQVVRDRLGRRVVRGEQRGSIGVGAAQRLLGQPSGQLLAHERVPEAVAAAHALEHAGRLGLAERLVDRSAPASAASSAPVKPSSITASAASSRSPNGSSRSSRRATTSRSRGGTVTSPEASTDAASSSAKNGLPAAERSMAARAPGGSGRAAARRATAASAARSSGPSATSTAAPRSSRLERTSAAASGSGSSRMPATTSRRSPAALRARWCTSAAVASSAACRSSIASTTPRSAAACASS